MRKLCRTVLSLLLALSMLCSMSLAAFASTEETEGITLAPAQTEPAPTAGTAPPAPDQTKPAPTAEAAPPAPAQTEPAPTTEEAPPAPDQTEPAPTAEAAPPAPAQTEPAPTTEEAPPAPDQTEPAPTAETAPPAPVQTEPEKTEEAAGAAKTEETAPQETEGETDEEDPTAKRYTWRHPITKKLYADLTWKEYQALLRSWRKEKKALLATGQEVPDNNDTEVIQQTQPEQTEEETAPEETAAQTVPEETVPEETAAQTMPEETVPEETVAQTVPEEAVPEETAAQTVPEETVPEETVAQAVPEETVPQETAAQETVPEETAETSPAGYYVDYYAGDKMVKVRGDSGISARELLMGLGVEIPEGAEIALDLNSVDTKNLTVTEVDGEWMITSNGTFFEADRELVILVNGVPTAIQVKDDESAKHFADRGDKVTLTDDVKIDDTSTSVIYDSGTTVIDLNGHTLKGSNHKDAEYAVVVDGSKASTTVSVTFMNGTIEAAQGAVKAMGNAVVNFINMTVKAAKEALLLDSTGNQDKVSTGTLPQNGSEQKEKVTTEANVDDRTTLITTDVKSDADTVVVKGENTDLYMDGTVVNKGKGYAIGQEKTNGKGRIMLDYNARLNTASGQELESGLPTPESGGARFAHEKVLKDSFPLVLDMNYDTLYRYEGLQDEKMIPTTDPARKGYTFVGWNTNAYGSGDYVTREYALRNGIQKLYAIWEEIPTGPADYAWLVRGTIEGSNQRQYTANTRLSISKKIAHIYFQNGGSQHLSPMKVEFRNVKSLMDMGAEYARVHLYENLYLEIDLEELADRAEETPDGKQVNTFMLERDQDGMICVTSGQTDVFCFSAKDMAKATKNNLILCFERGGLTVSYGEDEICDIKLPEGQFSKVKLDTQAKELSISKAEPRKK